MFRSRTIKSIALCTRAFHARTYTPKTAEGERESGRAEQETIARFRIDRNEEINELVKNAFTDERQPTTMGERTGQKGGWRGEMVSSAVKHWQRNSSFLNIYQTMFFGCAELHSQFNAKQYAFNPRHVFDPFYEYSNYARG